MGRNVDPRDDRVSLSQMWSLSLAIHSRKHENCHSLFQRSFNMESVSSVNRSLPGQHQLFTCKRSRMLLEEATENDHRTKHQPTRLRVSLSGDCVTPKSVLHTCACSPGAVTWTCVHDLLILTTTLGGEHCCSEPRFESRKTDSGTYCTFTLNLPWSQ